VACVVAAWDSIRSFWHHSEALALSIGLVVLIVLFAVLMWKKTSEISELRGLMHGLEQRDAEPPSDKQLDQLFEIIARSQQGYRDLIDSSMTFCSLLPSTARFAPSIAVFRTSLTRLSSRLSAGR